MKQEDKKLLLKDLCARLPYGVYVEFRVGDNVPDVRIFTGKDYDYLKGYHYIDEFTKCTFKPYLRLLSSMTKTEQDYIWNRFDAYKDGDIDASTTKSYTDFSLFLGLIDWLNAHHFDYRGLIEKGLALEAPEGIYK